MVLSRKLVEEPIDGSSPGLRSSPRGSGGAGPYTVHCHGMRKEIEGIHQGLHHLGLPDPMRELEGNVCVGRHCSI